MYFNAMGYICQERIMEEMVKKVVLAGISVVVLLIAFNLITQIISTLKSGERLAAQADIVFKLEAKNKELKKKLTQIESPLFIEEQARNKLGLSKPGETIVIIPDQKLRSVLGASNSAQQIRLPNWLGWWKVFFK